MCCIVRTLVLVLSVVSIGRANLLGTSQQRIQITGEEKSPFDLAFDAFVQATLQEWHVPGLSIAVVDDGKIFSKGYGHAVLPDIEATAETQYFTGSTTKAFTAAAAALLVHDEKYPDVRWASPIKDFLPTDFALEDPYATRHTTIEDALSHRSGLPRHDLMYGQQNDTPSSVVQRMRYLPMTAEPRTAFQYCNIMFGVVTDLVETITGRKLEDILHDNFWEPLGMSSTTFTPPSTADKQSRVARGYYWDPPVSEKLVTTAGKYVPEPYIDISPISGAGSTISTVNDYALWINAWLDTARGGSPENKSNPITKRVFHDLLSPRTIISDFVDDQASNKLGFITPPHYALGWITFRIGSETLVLHGGGLTGFGTEVYMLPGKSYGVVTMANTQDTSNTAGATIASRLLLEKLNITAAREALYAEVQENLVNLSTANVRRSEARIRRDSSFSELRISKSTSQTATLPCLASIAGFAGQYSHPAYGTISLTVSTQDHSSSEKILEGLLYPRTWPLKIQLFHVSNTVFAVKAYSPHGLGNITSGKDIVWENATEDDVRAVFELGLDGGVERMGIQLEESMVELANSKGARHWREGMIWFEKVTAS